MGVAVSCVTDTKKAKAQGEGLSGLIEEDMILIPDLIQLMTPLKNINPSASVTRRPPQFLLLSTSGFEPDDKDLLVI